MSFCATVCSSKLQISKLASLMFYDPSNWILDLSVKERYFSVKRGFHHPQAGMNTSARVLRMA